jgi:hypothetical protein
MPTAPSTSITVQIAEEGEAIGTVRQFARRMGVSRSTVWSCLEEGRTPFVSGTAGAANDPLLILRADEMQALSRCAERSRSPA